ncbi:phosphate butyryltransferase [bacterium]|nr:phosphate butyryltransferase [candidate division CSSED10-310 bacterium]
MTEALCPEGSQAQIITFEQLRAALQRRVEERGPVRVGVINSHELNVMRAVCDVHHQGLIEGVLIGDEQLTRELCEHNNLDISAFAVEHTRDRKKAVAAGAHYVVRDEVDFLVRGRITVYDLLHNLCKLENGFRRKIDLMTYVSVFQLRLYPRLLLLSDGGVVIAPTLDQKVRIINQAVDVALALGIREPRVALLAAVETVKSTLPVSLEQAALAKMGDRGQIGRAVIDGPLAFDVAISEHAAKVKKLDSPVAGRADILIAPQIEAGTSIYQALMVFGRVRAAGAVVGARAPVVISARIDTLVNRINSIHLAAWLALSCPYR